MRMTVGPLPPAVYWRRRVLVLAAVAVVVVLTAWACSPGEPDSKSGQAAGVAQASPSSSHRPGRHAGDGQPSGGPTTGSPTPDGSEPAGTPSASAPPAGSGDGAPIDASAPPRATDGPASHCSDDALTVSVHTAPRRHIPAGSSPALYLTIGNGSSKPCTRDIGADEQELHITHGDRTVWSSDYCDANHGSDVRRFDPGVHVTYRLVWDGRSASKGCKEARTVLPRGKYALVGRVGSKSAKPYPITLT